MAAAVDGTVLGTSVVENDDGAGEAGLEGFELALPIEGLDSSGADVRTVGVEEEADLTSRMPPPDVTSGFSAVDFRQNDHFDFASSVCALDSS